MISAHVSSVALPLRRTFGRVGDVMDDVSSSDLVSLHSGGFLIQPHVPLTRSRAPVKSSTAELQGSTDPLIIRMSDFRGIFVWRFFISDSSCVPDVSDTVNTMHSLISSQSDLHFRKLIG
ncbi:uncharacterized [Tachysurus ichikawai]